MRTARESAANAHRCACWHRVPVATRLGFGHGTAARACGCWSRARPRPLHKADRAWIRPSWMRQASRAVGYCRVRSGPAITRLRRWHALIGVESPWFRQRAPSSTDLGQGARLRIGGSCKVCCRDRFERVGLSAAARCGDMPTRPLHRSMAPRCCPLVDGGSRCCRSSASVASSNGLIRPVSSRLPIVRRCSGKLACPTFQRRGSISSKGISCWW